MESSKLLANLGQSLGLPLHFDTNKQCLLLMDESLIISIRRKETYWLLYCLLGEINTDISSPLWEWYSATNLFLIENQLGGLCYEKKTNTLFYIHSVDTPNTDEFIFNAFETIVDTYDGLLLKIKDTNLITPPINNR
ncbi:chaperone SicP [uncultured Shewanella sp.]|uniref:chaperone SicP n=1 Tax=uncultured Shewanella sp. TaxID=173975 RepID=UPI0026286115|nr:chaperone SicP [uncultured Shewanella sp.]